MWLADRIITIINKSKRRVVEADSNQSEPYHMQANEGKIWSKTQVDSQRIGQNLFSDPCMYLLESHNSNKVGPVYVPAIEEILIFKVR